MPPDLAQPSLTTARLLLRPFVEADAPTVEPLVSERAIAEMTLHIPHPYPAGAAAEWIGSHPGLWQSGAGVTYAVCEADSGTLVGAIGLGVTVEHAKGELGYWIGLPFGGRGYCTEAARAVVAFGFETLGLHRIQAHHFVKNPASGRVMQKLGMRHEGTIRGGVRKWGQFEDLALYGMLGTEWTTAP